MEKKKPIFILIASVYFITIGARIIYENIRLAQYTPIIILGISYLQAFLLINVGIFRWKWIRVSAICWSIVGLAISGISWLLGEASIKSVIVELLYYAVPILILIHPRVKEQFK